MPRSLTTPLRIITSTLILILTLSILLHITHRPRPSPLPPPQLSVYHTFASPPHVNSTYTFPTPSSGPNAAIFYATTSPMACSSLLNIARLRSFSPTLPIIALLTSDVSLSLRRRYASHGVHTILIPDTAIPRPNTILGQSDYYASSLVKLLSFGLDQPTGLPLPKTWSRKRRLERIVVLDADTLILADITPLFTTPALETNPIAAPPVYWQESETAVTSALMVAQLSPELWTAIKDAVEAPKKGEYDMDIVNRILQPARIGPEWLTLNSGFREGRIPSWAVGKEEDATADDRAEEIGVSGPREFWESGKINVLHYSDGGKPWDIVLPSESEVEDVTAYEDWGFLRRERLEQLVWGAWGREEREKRRMVLEGTEVWEEGVRIWQNEARGVCGWEQHVVEG